MKEILDQGEVDALLEAVESADLGASVTTMEGGYGGQVTGGEMGVEPVPYDFKRPERVSKDQMRSLETLHEIFARNFAVNLSSYVRAIVEIKVVSVEQLPYAEFIASLPNPTYFSLISCQPLEGEMVFEMNPSILYPVMDRLLGGGKAKPFVPDRALTEMEVAVARSLLDRALAQLTEAWENVYAISFRHGQTESNPLLMQIVPPTEPVVLTSFEVSLGEHIGLMNICIPFKVIEGIVEQFSSYTWFGYQRKRQRMDFRGALEEHISYSKLDVSVELARTRLALDQILNLRVGDVIQTQHQTTKPARVFIDRQLVFEASPGVLRGKRAAHIQRIVEGRQPPADS